jgi:3D (Asp-Asp-Asp) domain-containing protein
LGVLRRFRLKGLFALGAAALSLGYLVPAAHTVSGPAVDARLGHSRLVAQAVPAAEIPTAGPMSGRDLLLSGILDTTGLRVRVGGAAVQRRVLSSDLMDALTELGLVPGPGDRLALTLPGQAPLAVPVGRGTLVGEGMVVDLVRVTHQRQTTTAAVPFATRQEKDPGAPLGTQVVVDPGAEGVRTIVADVTLEDGVATARQVVSDQVTTLPRDRVVRLGTRSVLPYDHSYGVTFTLNSRNVTSYCLTGTTFTGTQAGPGSIAVDPAVIKLGSHLYVEGYGFGWAVDTGGGIHGDAVDVWYTCDQAIAWGRRAVAVYVLDH